jgi:hypothetical protein
MLQKYFRIFKGFRTIHRPKSDKGTGRRQKLYQDE